MAGKSMNAPLALVMVGTTVIGKLKTIRVSESIRRGKVMSLGNMIPEELPALEWSGTLSASFYMLNFNQNPIADSLKRNVGSAASFADNILLNESGVTIDIYKKVKVGVDSTGLVIPGHEKFASIIGAFSNRENFDISEGQISGRDVDFDYLTPILFV